MMNLQRGSKKDGEKEERYTWESCKYMARKVGPKRNVTEGEESYEKEKRNLLV